MSRRPPYRSPSHAARPTACGGSTPRIIIAPGTVIVLDGASAFGPAAVSPAAYGDRLGSELASALTAGADAPLQVPDAPRGAELVGEPDADETAEDRWVPVEETPEMIARSDILEAMTIIGVQLALLRRAATRVAPP